MAWLEVTSQKGFENLLALLHFQLLCLFILVSKDVIVRLSAPAAMPDAGCHVPVLLPWTLIPLDNNHRQINSQKLPLLLYHSSGKGVSPLNQGISNPSCAQAE